MTFHLAAGALVIDKGGITRFNSDDQLLHGAASGLPISGTVAIAAVTGGAGVRVDSTTVYDLGAVTSGHTQLIGAVKFDLNNDAAGLAFDRWHTVMGGSVVWVMDGEPGFAAALGDNNDLQQWVDYHFRINAGRAEMVRRLFIDDSPFSYTVLSHTVSFKLRSGNWT